MEAQDVKQIALRKAINAHDEAEGALRDLMKPGSEPRFEGLLERIRQNLEELHQEVGNTAPDESL